MKRPKIKLAKCPCCLTDKHRTEIRTCISILEGILRKGLRNNRVPQLSENTYDYFVDADFEWACDNCLWDKKAILAIPELQETSWSKDLAHFDTQLHCFTCKREFLFKKEEKKAWYESYKLPLNAQPNNCLSCRRKLQKASSENKAVSEILQKTESEITDTQLEEVISIYTAWGKIEKAKYYQSILNKRKKIKH